MPIVLVGLLGLQKKTKGEQQRHLNFRRSAPCKGERNIATQLRKNCCLPKLEQKSKK